MKNLICLLIGLSMFSCCRGDSGYKGPNLEPKFHFKGCVKVIDGFYVGFYGRAVSYKIIGGIFYYGVSLPTKPNVTSIEVSESDLEWGVGGCSE